MSSVTLRFLYAQCEKNEIISNSLTYHSTLQWSDICLAEAVDIAQSAYEADFVLK